MAFRRWAREGETTPEAVKTGGDREGRLKTPQAGTTPFLAKYRRCLSTQSGLEYERDSGGTESHSMELLIGTHARHAGVGGVCNMHWNLAGTDISEDHDAILDPSSWLAIIFVIKSSRLSSYAAQ